jgi:hypothetical protein
MFGERRKSQRYSINRIAKFHGENGSLPRDCTITDISETGARLFASGDDIPDQFMLLITGDKPIREECRVAWRLGGEVGVEFVTKERELRRAELVKRLRAETRQTLVKAT